MEKTNSSWWGLGKKTPTTETEDVVKKLDFFTAVSTAANNCRIYLVERVEHQRAESFFNKLHEVSYYDFWMKPSSVYRGITSWGMPSFGADLANPVRALHIRFIASMHGHFTLEELINFIISNSPTVTDEQGRPLNDRGMLLESPEILNRIQTNEEMRKALTHNPWIVTLWYLTYF